MAEQLFTPIEKPTERIPGYDSFGDADEALAWVLMRLNHAFSADDVSVWWTEPQASMGDLSPASLWEVDPDAVLQAVARV